MKKILLICFVLLNLASANDDCTLDDDVLLTVLMNERSEERAIGYKYLISLNNEKDQDRIKKDSYFKSMRINNRTLDCKDSETCVEVLNKLLGMNIKNLDIGAFQVNSVYHLGAFKTYYSLFDIDDSRKFACAYIMAKVKKLGYSWESIAAYHSETPEYNEIYKEGLIKNYNLLLSSKN